MSIKPSISVGKLLVWLAILYSIIFFIYWEANPRENFWVQLWNYLESNIFIVVTVSLVFPIILLVLESRFKIVETIEKNRKEELRARRLECLELTSQMWNQLFSLASEVIHYKKDVDEGASIEKILQRLENLPSWGEDIVNMWSFRFPNLSDKDQNLFLDFINIIVESTVTVAYSIQEIDNPEEITELQDLLLVIQICIGTIAHHPIINVLKYSMELLDGGVSPDRKEDTNFKIQDNIGILKYWSEEIKMEKREHNKILSSIGGAEVEAFRDKVKKVEECVREHPEYYIQDINKCEELDNFEDLFYKISLEKRAHVEKHPYSIEYLRHIANWLNFKTICSHLVYEAKQPD